MNRAQRSFRRIGIIGHQRYPALEPTLLALGKFAREHDRELFADRELLPNLPGAAARARKG